MLNLNSKFLFFLHRRASEEKPTSLCFLRVSTGLAVKVHSGLLVNTTNTSTAFPFSRAQAKGRVQSVVPLELNCDTGVEYHGRHGR